MRTPLVAIIASDATADAERIADEIRGCGYDLAYRRVETNGEFCDAVRSQAWDLIIANCHTSGFSSIEALDHLRESPLDIPFIVITDAANEQPAIECLKRGADDYVPADQLSRVGPAVRYALKAREDRRACVRMEEQLRHAQRLATIGTLAGGLAHDFSNLLTAVAGSAELLAPRIKDDEKGLQALETIQRAVKQATDLTRSLLAFSHRMPSARQPIILEEVTKETAQLLERMLPRTVELKVEVGDAAESWVDADRVQIQQTLLNLATNARDAMPDGGCLRISVESTGAAGDATDGALSGTVRLVVSDTGIGMEKDVEARVFEPFFSTKPREKGIGLGLSIVRDIVRNHGAKITFETAPGKGAVFTVDFPRIAAPASAAEDNLDRQRGRGETILLADRRPYVRELIASALASLDFNVIRLGDAAAVRSVCESQDGHVDLLIMDSGLPGGGGFSCLEQLRSAGIRVPAIITADQSEQDQADTLPEGCLVLCRPFQMADVARLVAAALRQWREPSQ